MSDPRARYLASESEPRPPDHERVDLIRQILESEAAWAEPPAGVEDGLLAEMGRSDQGFAGSRPLRRWPWAVVGIAVTLALIVGLAASTLFGDDAARVALRGTDLMAAASGEAIVHPANSGWLIELSLEGLPPAADGSFYEGWVWSDDGEGVSIGTFHLRGGDEEVTLWSGVDPDEYPSIWVTLETEDGDATASGVVLLRGRPDEDS